MPPRPRPDSAKRGFPSPLPSRSSLQQGTRLTKPALEPKSDVNGVTLDRVACHVRRARDDRRNARSTACHGVRGVRSRARWGLLDQGRNHHRVDCTVRRIRIILSVVCVHRAIDRPQVGLASPPLSARPRRKEYRYGDGHQDCNDQDNDHELDQREAFLPVKKLAHSAHPPSVFSLLSVVWSEHFNHLVDEFISQSGYLIIVMTRNIGR